MREGSDLGIIITSFPVLLGRPLAWSHISLQMAVEAASSANVNDGEMVASFAHIFAFDI